MMGERLAKKVLVIGWDGADWKHIQPLLDKGWMPHLQQFMERGAWGNLATLNPSLSPMLWNSIATGKRPHKHGILGFTEPMPDGKGIRPSSSTTRTCKAIWNILTQAGMTANVVGWFSGHPAEPINGICVTELFQKLGHRGRGAKLPAREEWKLADDVVHPVELRDELVELRVHPAELTQHDLGPFVPNLAKVDQKKDPRLEMVAYLVAEMASVHAAATHVIEKNGWDFMAVYYDSVDHFCHGFMRYHPPRMANVREEDFEIYKDAVTGCYRFHDLMLGRLLQLAGEDTTVILCSDHGFHSDHLRPMATPREPAGPAVWHREYGVICMAGPGIKAGERIMGASLLDITPTALALLGQPPGEDMDGKPLVQVFDQRVWVQRVPSWEDVDGTAGMHPPDRRENPFEAREVIQRLVELGYIDKPDENAEKAAESAARESKYNAARAYMDAGLPNEAGSLLEELVKAEPNTQRFLLQLARCRVAQERYADARQLGQEILDQAEAQRQQTIEAAERRAKRLEENPNEALARGKQRAREAHEKAVEAEKKRAAEDGREPRTIEPFESRLTPESLKQAQERLTTVAERLRKTDLRVTPWAHLLLGTLELAERNTDAAQDHLLRAEQAEPRLPGLHNRLGQLYLRMRRNEEAERAFHKALDIDGDNAMAQEGLATALSRLGRMEEAAEHALTAVELMHNMPRAHLRLGVTLANLKLFEESVRAFETCLKLAPMTVSAHRWLSRIYRLHLGRPDKSFEHKQKADDIRRWRTKGPDESATLEW